MTKKLMARSLLTLHITLLFAGAMSAQPAAPSKVQALTVHSSIMNEDRRVLIRLPHYYERDSTARYPVMYKFDGDNQLQRYDDVIDVLSSFDAISDLIVVALPNARGQRNRDLTPASLHQQDGVNGSMGTGDMGGGDRFLDFIEQELIPHIDKLFRTTSERLLAGHSRGALVVLRSLLTKPDLFRARFMFSAPLTRDEQRMIVDTRQFFKQNRKHQSFLYCNWGEAENEGMNQSYNAFRTLLSSEAPAGLRWVAERARAADHQTTQGIALPSALHEYFAGRARTTGIEQNRKARATSTQRRSGAK